MIARLLLGGVGVELGPDAVEPVQDVEGAPLRRPLEQRVLDEVREPVLAVQLIPRPRLDQQAAVPDVAPVFEVHAPNAVRQRPRVKSRRVGRHRPAKVRLTSKGRMKKGGRRGSPFCIGVVQVDGMEVLGHVAQLSSKGRLQKRFQTNPPHLVLEVELSFPCRRCRRGGEGEKAL